MVFVFHDSECKSVDQIQPMYIGGNSGVESGILEGAKKLLLAHNYSNMLTKISTLVRSLSFNFTARLVAARKSDEQSNIGSNEVN